MSQVPRLIPATVHGRFYLRKATSEAETGLLVAFHGYGLHARRMLEEIEFIRGAEDWNVVSIQGLHPFYDPTSGKVGASWMTRQDREVAIEDNIRYVSEVVRAVRAEIGEEGPLVYLGFSQGAAMAHRAAAFGATSSHGVMAIVGDVPPELAECDLSAYPPVFIGCGDSDRWYDETKLQADLDLLESAGVRVEPYRFTGGHEWTDELRERCGGFLSGLRR